MPQNNPLPDDHQLRNRLINHIKGGQAFASLDNVINKLPFYKLGVVPDNLPYSFFQLFWHIRVAQVDILEYCRSSSYNSPNWPDDYWPEQNAPANEHEWKKLVDNYFNEREAFCELIQDKSNDLMKPLPGNPEHNLFRQAQLIIEHTSFHTGQLYILLRLLSNEQPAS